MPLCQPVIWSMAAILRDSTVVVVVAAAVRTHLRAIPLAMITIRKSTHGFPFVSCMGMGLRLAALWAAGALLSISIDCGKPTKAEIRKAIRQLKNEWQGSGHTIDEIPEKAINIDPEILAEMLYGLFEKLIWEEEKIPSEWKEGILIKIPRKEDHGSCSNCRVITLFSVPRKVLNRVTLERLRRPVDLNLWEQQAGSKPCRSCTNQVTTFKF